MNYHIIDTGDKLVVCHLHLYEDVSAIIEYHKDYTAVELESAHYPRKENRVFIIFEKTEDNKVTVESKNKEALNKILSDHTLSSIRSKIVSLYIEVVTTPKTEREAYSEKVLAY